MQVYSPTSQNDSDLGGETFIQRMKRLQGQDVSAAAGTPQQGQQTSPNPPAQTSANFADFAPTPGPGPAVLKTTAPQSSGDANNFANADGQQATPVTGDGKIPPPTAAAPQAAPQPAQSQPAAQPAQPAQSTLPAGMPVRPDSTNLQPMTLAPTTAPTYQATDFASVPNPEAYKAGAISQFSGPDQTQLAGGQADLAKAILGSPESMSPEVVSQLQNANKEQALLMAKQAGMQIANSRAGRGMSGGGGELADMRRLNEDTISGILSGNRDIAARAATQNFQDKLNSLGAIDQILNSGVNRATSTYGATLAGQNAAEAAKQAAAASGLDTSQFGLAKTSAQAANNLQNYNVERQNQQDTLNKQLSQFGINQAIAGNAQDNYKTDSSNFFSGLDATRADQALALQKQLGEAGVNLDTRKLDSANSQFDKNYALNILQFLEGQREANNNLGYNYTALNNQGQNQTLQTVLALMGGG